MSLLSNFRENYPEYDTYDDERLLQALHKKDAPGVPFSNFKQMYLLDEKLEKRRPNASDFSADTPGPKVEQLPLGERPLLSPVSQVWRGVREQVAPVAEALGTAGGAALGVAATAPVGLQTAGAASLLGGSLGAGLGLATTRKGLQIIDVLTGTPVSVTSPVSDVAEGASFEAAGPAIGRISGSLLKGGVRLGKKVGNVVEGLGDVFRIPQMLGASPTPSKKIASKLLKSSAGSELQNAREALLGAEPGVTARQALSEVNGPAVQSLLQRGENRAPEFFPSLRENQEMISQGRISNISGGSTATDTRASGEQVKDVVTRLTQPAREKALNAANTAARKETTGILAANTPEEFEELLKASKKSEWKKGLVRGFRKTIRDPKNAGNKTLEDSLRLVIQDMDDWTRKDGSIDFYALDSIRKNSVGEAVRRSMDNASENQQKRATASILPRVNELIDKAIESSGGKGYKEALAKYSAGLKQMEQMGLTAKALDLYKTSKDEFVKLVQRGNPDLVEEYLGKGSYDIAKELSDNTMTVLRKEADNVIRNLKIDKSATAGQEKLKELLIQHIPRYRLPSRLNFLSTATNKTLEELEKKLGREVMNELTLAAKTPKGTLDLLNAVPDKTKSRILKVLESQRDWSKYSGPLAVGVTSYGRD